MATQGLLSIIKDNQVQFKLVLGSQGMSLPYMKSFLIENPNASLEDIHKEARNIFGEESTVLQINENEAYFMDKLIKSEDINELYKNKFHDPNFNPRWEHGTADYQDVLNLDAEHTLRNQAESNVIKRTLEPVHLLLTKNNDAIVIQGNHFSILKTKSNEYKEISKSIFENYSYALESFDSFRKYVQHDLEMNGFRNIFLHHLNMVAMKPLNRTIDNIDDYINENENIAKLISTEKIKREVMADVIAGDEKFQSKIDSEVLRLKSLDKDSSMTI